MAVTDNAKLLPRASNDPAADLFPYAAVRFGVKASARHRAAAIARQSPAPHGTGIRGSALKTGIPRFAAAF